METIGQRIRRIREDRRINIPKLAKLAELSDTQMRKIEKGEESNPRRDTLERIAKALNVPISFLLEGKDIFRSARGEYTISYVNPDSPSPIQENTPQENALFEYGKQAIDELLKVYGEPLTYGVVALHNMDKKKENLPKNLSPIIYRGKGIEYPVISGAAACGSLTCIPEDIIEDWISLPEEFNIKADFIITAKGTCLEQERIFEGYLVFIKQQETCESGNIVAIRVMEKGEAFAILKKVKFLSNGTLIFTNGTGDLLELKDNMQIIGKVVYFMPDPRKTL